MNLVSKGSIAACLMVLSTSAFSAEMPETREEKIFRVSAKRLKSALANIHVLKRSAPLIESGLAPKEARKEARKLIKAEQSKMLESVRNPYSGPKEFKLRGKNTPWGMNYFPSRNNGVAYRWKVREQRSQSRYIEMMYPFHMDRKSNLTPKDYRQKRKLWHKEFQLLDYGQLGGAAGLGWSESVKYFKNLERLGLIDFLSPMEKWEIYKGNYNFPGTLYEFEERGRKNVYVNGHIGAWISGTYTNGFCNGARAAGVFTDEPVLPVSVKNAEGIKVTFSPADMKALLASSYFYVQIYNQIGSPSHPSNTDQVNKDGYIDMGAFDMALRSYMASEKRGFFIDDDADDIIVNVTAVGYKRKLGKRKSLSSDERKKYTQASYKIPVKLELEILAEITYNESDMPTRAKVESGKFTEKRKLKYNLFINKAGKIVGGRAIGKEPLDFLWFAAGKGMDGVQKNKATGGVFGNPHLTHDELMKIAKRSFRKSK